ncbi:MULTISPECIES: ABC transporter substrate-binding protein [Psychrobacillus]|uniref:ABC transporter substrate-binding protein n=1 Tax=Psychrobacillus faecigallinarum TaxID=2762235 RepID=A0ABR8RAM0_9BACI|nr:MULTISPECIES: ABC transporter substrate-binding protein [Psychrobacillus]MBD7944843.1 ABC transporter substrate-binding protein [Psychrobacillus faecigallinarum]QEY21292.1 taurine ABC transporter substrate-binding protein [Psychrobacillus sp. AK 1817]QGM31807.1 PhnD/SsuA/transferrin family substrate-binding protein [Bacillus sp. N3536]
MKKRWFILFASTILLLGACSSKEKESSGSIDDQVSKDNPSGDLAPLDKKAKVIIAEDGAASGAGFYIAKEKGYFEDYNIEVEFAQFANSDEMLPALASGDVDIAGGVSTASFFNAIAQGIDVKIIADKGHNVPGKSYFTFVIGNHMKDVIKEYKDFEGKRIAVSSKNSIDEYIYLEMLKHAGLTQEDVEFVLLGDFGSMLGAIENGSIDAALQIEPLITQGIENGFHERFGDATDYAPESQIAMVLGSPQFMSEEQDVSLRFMAAYLKGVRDYNDAFIKGEGKAEIIEIMTKHTSLKDPALWEKVFVTGLDPDGKMFLDDVVKQYDAYKENGAISGDVDFDKAVDTSITEKAVEILGEYK